MKDRNLKRASISGLVYRFLERILAQLVSTIVTIVLARLLLPEEYGIISLITILITLCNVLVSDGLSSALIQKRDADELDYSTICWASVGLSAMLVVGLFFAAPAISRFYNEPQLTAVLRVMALRIPLAAFNSVQGAYVSKNFLFRKFFYSTLIGTVTSGFVGIIMAYHGFGVWSLVAQYLTNSFMDTGFLFLNIDWKPKWQFSLSRFKEMFAFGLNVLVSGLLNEVYEELRSLIIAKQYTTADLSFYSKGKQFPQLIGNNVTATITQVLFPVFSTQQDDVDNLKKMLRRSLRVGSYVLCPMMFGFIAISDTFVRLVLTDKWIQSVPYIQVFCIMYIFKPLRNINRCAMKAVGRSDIDLKINMGEKVLGIALIFGFLSSGPYALAVSACVTYVVVALVYMFYTSKLLDYSMLKQISDILPECILAIVACLPSHFMNYLDFNLFSKFFAQIIVAVCLYVVFSIVFKVDSFKYIVSTVKGFSKG